MQVFFKQQLSAIKQQLNSNFDRLNSDEHRLQFLIIIGNYSPITYFTGAHQASQCLFTKPVRLRTSSVSSVQSVGNKKHLHPTTQLSAMKVAIKWSEWSIPSKISRLYQAESSCSADNHSSLLYPSASDRWVK